MKEYHRFEARLRDAVAEWLKADGLLEVDLPPREWENLRTYRLEGITLNPIEYFDDPVRLRGLADGLGRNFRYRTRVASVHRVFPVPRGAGEGNSYMACVEEFKTE